MSHSIFVFDLKTLIVLAVVAVAITSLFIAYLLAAIVDVCTWIARKARKALSRNEDPAP